MVSFTHDQECEIHRHMTITVKNLSYIEEYLTTHNDPELADDVAECIWHLMQASKVWVDADRGDEV